ncbi:caspase family protein [Pararhodobacter sp. SW119]|uniref:caspase family protein n=1 Tax=Pararhodobacter sp. SW119 TaxID=2780075 RepID=UPI001AE07168|nr:caspase family protein [Pararhodobacter sp. SW119]
MAVPVQSNLWAILPPAPSAPGRPRRVALARRFLALLLVFLLLLALPLRPALAEMRVALVIGNADYAAVPALENPVNDSRDVSAALESLNFRVFRGENLTQAELRAQFDEFLQAAHRAEVALLFYAGHGLQVGARNFIVPTDFAIDGQAEVMEGLIPLDEMLAELEKTPALKLIFLDACRDNPLGAEGAEDGLARVGSAADFLFAFATQPDNVAYDGLGRNSFFTEALLSRIHTPGQDISELMIGVRRDVLSATGGRQIPWENSSLTRQFRFLPGAEAVSPETMLWQVASRAQDPVLMHLYLERFPQGAHIADVRSFLQLGEGSVGESVIRRLPGTGDIEAERLWTLAQRTRMRPLVERYLQLFPQGANAADARRLLEALPAARDDAPVRQCERLATHPRDATANTAGVEFSVLQRNAGAAVAACEAAVEAFPEVPHLTALLARAKAATGAAEEAIALYRRAAAAGDLRAMVSLGLLHEAGDGVPRDLDAAMRLYSQAAEAGSPDAAINLAVALFEGRGVTRDVVRAVELFEQASAAGSAIATFNLGVLQDRGVAQVGETALDLFLRAAREGEPNGYRAAATLLDEGRGTPPDPLRAAELLLRAVAADDGRTLVELTQTNSGWSRPTIRALQGQLRASGHYGGAVDGESGPALETALRNWRNGGLLASVAD